VRRASGRELFEIAPFRFYRKLHVHELGEASPTKRSKISRRQSEAFHREAL
jgi:hypothetical protein